MQILYIDDSGKIHAKDQGNVAVFAGFSIPEERWHKFVGQVNGIKASIYPSRGDGKPNAWEIKSKDFLTVNSWQRAKARKLCFELARSLHTNNGYVYSISLDRRNLTDPPVEEKFVPLMLQRLIFTFHDQVANRGNSGSVVLDASTHELDQHITKCISSMVVSKQMTELIGGVTYGKSAALPPLQVADIIASVFRREAEGETHVADLAAEFRKLAYTRPEALDAYGNPIFSIGRVC
jgi:hypothetical protein